MISPSGLTREIVKEHQRWLLNITKQMQLLSLHLLR